MTINETINKCVIKTIIDKPGRNYLSGEKDDPMIQCYNHCDGYKLICDLNKLSGNYLDQETSCVYKNNKLKGE